MNAGPFAYLLMPLIALACSPAVQRSTERSSVVICAQEWMTKDLDVVTYRNGDPIPEVKDAAAWIRLTNGAWCWVDTASASGSRPSGRLYNWYAVNDPRGLSPKGWHVPSDAEWHALEACLGPDSAAYRLRGAGWPGRATTADNSSGFDATPNLQRSTGETYAPEGEQAVFWLSGEGSSSEAWCARVVHFTNVKGAEGMATGVGYVSKTDGYRVRCVKDHQKK